MFVAIILSISITFLSVLYFLFRINFKYWTYYPQIPSVKGKIFSGNLIDFLTFKTNFAYNLRSIYEADQFKNDAVVGIYGLYQPGLLIREPELIKSIFIKDFDCFSNRPCRTDVRHDPVGALNLAFSEYSEWREMRLKFNPVFSSAKLKFMYPLIQKVGTNLHQYLSKLEDCCQQEIKKLSERYVTDALTTTILGTSSCALQDEKHFMYMEAKKLTDFNFKRALDFLVIFFAPKLNRVLRPRVFYESTEKFMRSFIPKIIAEREKSDGTRNDLIDAFVKIKQEAKNKGEDIPFCMEKLISHASVFTAGSFDSSSNTLANAMFELSKNHEVQQKLRTEILQAFKEGKGEISYESLNKMEYLQMVIDETLRIYPVLPLLERRYILPTNKQSGFNLKPFYDYTLRNEMPVYVSVFGLHYDPKYWPNPTKFDPERFSPDKKQLMTPMTYLPFGEGPHKCIGSRFGLLVIKIGLTVFLKNHFVQVCEETVSKPEFDARSILLKIKGGLHLEIVRDNLYEKEANN